MAANADYRRSETLEKFFNFFNFCFVFDVENKDVRMFFNLQRLLKILSCVFDPLVDFDKCLHSSLLSLIDHF